MELKAFYHLLLYTEVKTPERIVMKFCMMVGLPDVVTRVKLDSHFRVVGGRISGFPIDFGSRPYNTLARARV